MTNDELVQTIKDLTEETKSLTTEVREILRYIRSDIPLPKRYDIKTSDDILEKLK